MAYDGEVIDACGVTSVNLSKVDVVAVSGAGPNICGHTLLHANGHYFHVAVIHGQPHHMNEAGYRRYLVENGKTEIRRVTVTLPDPAGAEKYLERLMASTWTWYVVPNNCVAFVEEVIAAGGGTWASATNCPTVATAPDLSHRVQEFMQRLENEIYTLYGVPR